MPSFEYQKKIKQEFLEEKKEKKCRALLFKMLKLRVLDLFFHWNKCFCYYTESKVPKKGTVWYRYRISGTDTGTGSNVNGTQPYWSHHMMSGRSKWHKDLTSLKIYLKKRVWKVQHMALTAVLF